MQYTLLSFCVYQEVTEMPQELDKLQNTALCNCFELSKLTRMLCHALADRNSTEVDVMPTQCLITATCFP